MSWQQHREQDGEHLSGSPPWGPSRARTGPAWELQEAPRRCLGALLPGDRLPAALAGPLLWALPTPDIGYEHFSLLFCMNKRQASCQLSPLKRQPRERPFQVGSRSATQAGRALLGSGSRRGGGRRGPHKASRRRLHALGRSSLVYSSAKLAPLPSEGRLSEKEKGIFPRESVEGTVLGYLLN